jgi:mannose-6-phosphate isomerase-like protein (cupin superfamily)
MHVIRATEQPFVPASHEDPRRPGVFKRVILTRDELIDGRVQMINWARLPAGSSFRAHYHEDMQETFVIVSGRCTMRVADATVELIAGDTLVIAPREVHSMHNHGTEQVVARRGNTDLR